MRAGLVLALLALFTSGLEAQGFGRAVAVAGEDVLVGQPDYNKRPGIVYLYRRNQRGDWVERAQLAEVARSAVDAMARCITPVGTQFDGDIVFAVSVGATPPATPVMVELLAQRATAVAIERAVRMAKGTKEVPGLAD